MEADYRDSEQYQRLASAIRERLAQTGLARAARVNGLELQEDGSLRFPSFGREISVSPGNFLIENTFSMWHELVLMQYLADGDGRQPRDCWMGLAQFDVGGLTRGGSFDQEVRKLAGEGLSGYDAREIARACRALGGEEDESMGDVTFNFMLAPRFPLQALIWLSDDEFPASAKVLVDGNAEYYLGVEAAGTIACVLIQEIARQLRK